MCSSKSSGGGAFLLRVAIAPFFPEPSRQPARARRQTRPGDRFRP